MKTGIFKETLIPEDSEAKFVQYKYEGSDNSLLYNYVFSPISQKIVDNIMPKWVA